MGVEMRWIVRLLGAVILVAVLGVAVLFAIPSERIAEIATSRLEQSLQRRVVISGDVRPTLYPILGVRAEGLEIGNPDWAEADGPLITADALAVGVALTPLFSGQIQIEEAILEGPDITLVRAADGRESWDFSQATADVAADQPEAAAAEGSGSAIASLGFDEARISDGAMRYIDRSTGTDIVVTELDLTLSMPSAAAQGAAAYSARVNGQRLSGNVQIESVAGLLDGEVQPISLRVEWDGGTAVMDGVAGLDPLVLDAQTEIDASDFSPLAALAGTQLAPLPAGLGRDSVGVSGQVVLAPEGSVHLRDGQIELDGRQFDAALDLYQGDERPRLRGSLSGASMDLSALTGSDAAQGGSSSGGGASGWPRDPIDLSGLFAVDAELVLGLGVLDFGYLETSNIDLRATLDNGRMVMSLSRADAYGGTLSGEMVLNGRGGNSMRGDLAFRGVQLQPLLTELADFERLSGSGDIAVQFLGSGASLQAIMESLDGGGSITFGQGAIEGFDLAGMIRNFDAGYRGEGQRTVYDSVTATFAIAGGVLQNDDLLLSAPWGGVSGAGRADLGGQTLEYRVIPTVTRGENGLSVPILIRGPWADLSFRPDLEFLAEQELAAERERLEAEARARLEEERDRLEQEARERVQEEVGQALGVDVNSETTTEEIQDSLEDRLRQEAEQQLRNLFQRD